MNAPDLDRLIAEMLGNDFVTKPRAYVRDHVRTLVAEVQKYRPQLRRTLPIPKHCGRLNEVYACFLPPAHEGEHKPERYK